MKKRIMSYLMIMAASASIVACGSDKTVQNPQETVALSGEVSDEADNASVVEEEPAEVEEENDNESNVTVVQEVVDPAQQLLASIVGDWGSDYYIDNRNLEIRVSVDATGAYKARAIYGADGWTNYTYTGNVVIENYEDTQIAVFKLDETDDPQFKGWDSLGDFYIDAVRENEYGTHCLYMTQCNNGDSLFSMKTNEFRPVLYEYANPYEGENAATLYVVDNPSDEYYFNGTSDYKLNYSLKAESVESNDITDFETWFRAIGRTMPDYYWMDDKYLYCKSEVKGYEYSMLNVYDNTADGGEAPLIYSFDMSNYQFAGGFDWDSAYNSFVTQGIKYALIEDGILYISTGHRTYSESCMSTGYITAIDINTGKVIWKSQPRVCNSDSFAIVDDTIVCGYGFTAEPDYLYVLDKRSGETLQQYDVKNAPDYIYYIDGKLYVRTYSYNYVYSLVQSE